MDYILIGIFIYLMIGLFLVEGSAYLAKRRGEQPLPKLARVIIQVGWIFLVLAIIFIPSLRKK